MSALVLVCSSAVFAQQYTISTIAGGVPPLTPNAALSVPLDSPQRVAVDGSGNVYISSGNSVFKLSGNTLTLIAGNSRPGFSGDGGLAVNAELNSPKGLAVDKSGNVYIADSGNNRVRMVSPDGIITTFAGTGEPGYSGDWGAATDAQLHLPSGVAIDSAGNVYIADSANQAVRVVYPNTAISTLAGTGYAGYQGDQGAATVALLTNPSDVTVDSSGNVYIADSGNNCIRKVDTNFVITTYAGAGTTTTDGGAALDALLNVPFSVSVDGSGNLYVTEFASNRVRSISSKGLISTSAGTGTAGFAGDGSTAAKALLSAPTGVAVDSSGNLYIADFANLRVRQVASSGNITTVAGTGGSGYSGDGGPANKAQLNAPKGAALDPAGNVYIADTRNNRIRQISTKGTINTVAGTGAAGSSGDGGQAVAAQLNAPAGVATDKAGNLYIADVQNHRVRRVGTDGSISTIAGTGTAGYGGDGGAAGSAALNYPNGVAVDAAGNVYVAELGNSRVRKISTDGTITTAAGNGVAGYGGDGGPATQASLNGPLAVAVDPAGDLFIADTGNNRIRLVTPDGTITTFAGTGQPGESGDGGPALSAQLAAPAGLALDAAGNLFVADGSSRIRVILPDRTIATVAGTAAGYAGDSGAAIYAALNGPSGLAVDSSGNIYVADTANSAVRLMQLAGYGALITGIVNSASGQAGALAPGETVVLYGSGLGPAALVQAQPDANGQVGVNTGGAQIFFNSTPAPLLYVSANQAAAVVPYEVSGTNVKVTAHYLGQNSAAFTASLAGAAPGVFTLDGSGQGQASALNADGSPNLSSSPASAGTSLSLYVTGTGENSPATPDGVPPSSPSLPIAVTIGGQSAPVRSANGIAGLVGAIQVTVEVPGGLSAGSVPVVVSIGNVPSQSGVTVAVSGS